MRIHLSGRAAAVFLMLGLAGVPDAPALAAPAAAAPLAAVDKEQQHALMQSIFGDDYDPEAGRALAVVRDQGADKWFLMTLESSTDMADGRTVAAVNGRPSNEDGADAVTHVGGMLNLYVLRRVGTDWEVVERHENLGTLGSWGDFGSVEWVSLGLGKPGFIVRSGDSGQGYYYEDVSVFELGKEVRRLGGFPKSSNNGGACAPDDVRECWDIDSTIRFADSPPGGAYRDILVDFTGKHYTVTEGKDGHDVEHLKSSVRQTARYHFDGKEYVLVSGTNPVSDI